MNFDEEKLFIQNDLNLLQDIPALPIANMDRDSARNPLGSQYDAVSIASVTTVDAVPTYTLQTKKLSVRTITELCKSFIYIYTRTRTNARAPKPRTRTHAQARMRAHTHAHARTDARRYARTRTCAHSRTCAKILID